MKKINGAGYTIVELMIVLAITGVIAITALTMTRGQQVKNEFAQAVRDFETKLNDIANDVNKGYFPDIGGNQVCTAGATGISFAAGSVGQGGSTDCVFAGKILRFNISGGDESSVDLMTLVARRRTRDDKAVTSLASLSDNDLHTAPGLNETFNLLYGMRPISVKYRNARAHNAVAFVSGFTNRSSDSSNFSGAPETNLYWIERSRPARCSASLAAALRQPRCYTTTSTRDGDRGIEICMQHGSRRVLFRIGQEGRLFSTSTEIDSRCTS